MNEGEKDGYGWIHHRSGVQTTKEEGMSGCDCMKVSWPPARRRGLLEFRGEDYPVLFVAKFESLDL